MTKRKLIHGAEQIWAEYWSMVKPDNPAINQEDETKQAFFSGMWAFYYWTLILLEDESDGSERVKLLADEIEAWIDTRIRILRDETQRPN